MPDKDNNITSDKRTKNDDNFSAQDIAYFVCEVIIVIVTLIFIIYYSYIAYTQNLNDFAIFKEIIIGTVKLIILVFLFLRIVMKIADLIDSRNKNDNT